MAAATLGAAAVVSTAVWTPASAQPKTFATTLRGVALPVRTASDPFALPAVRGDRFEIRLDASASARAFRRDAGRTMQSSALGIASIDAAAAAAGVLSFEPEFPGESPPPTGSRETDFTAFYVARLAPGASLDQALELFRRSPGVGSAGAIPILRVSAMPNDSLWSQSWWFYDPAGRNDVHAPEAWDRTIGDSAIVVGIIDSGVIPYHPDLGDVLGGWPGQIWTNPAERAGLPGVDDDGNGYVDDLHGWDFVDTPGASPAPGEDGMVPDNDPNDYAGHGTAVAGLVGALSNNGRGVAGTNWNVRLMPLRIAWSEPAPFLDGVVDMLFAAQALRYATRMGANVVNCSFQTLDTEGLYAAASAAIQAGVVIVTAAGNGDDFHDLQDREDVIAVAATDADDVLAAFSNWGEYVDLAAPGVGVGSTFVNRALQVTATDSVGYRQPAYRLGLSGTSFASPLVAGGVALALAADRAIGAPPLRPMEAVFRVRETADVTSVPEGKIGGGRLNMARAMTERDVSFAMRAGAGIVGSPVVLGGPPHRVAFATEGSRLMFADGAGDTLYGVALPGLPIAGPAAADMGGGAGGAIFVTLAGGAIAGLDPSGVALPGWPISLAGDGVTFAFSPVLADVDGDSTRDVVCASTEGTVFAFDVAGAMLPAFPIPTDGTGLAAPIAVAELDSVPGVDVVLATMSRRIYALRADAANPRLTGWPKLVPAVPRAPLVARLGQRPTPCIAVAFGATVRLFEANGATRFDLGAPGTVVHDPIAVDLDGDGFDELVVAGTGPDAVTGIDSSATWTQPMPGPVGPLLARGRGGVQVLFPASAPIDPTTGPSRSRLRGLDGLGGPLPLFPKAGAVSGEATAFAIESDGAARLLAGGADSLLYYYRLPSLVLSGDPGWFTARADFARTGNRMSLAPLAMLDDTAGRVTDLTAIAASQTTVTLRWTAPGNVPGVSSRPRHYDVRASTSPILDDQDFAVAPLRHTVIATVDSGGTETFVFGGLAPGTRYFFALKPFRLPISNSAEAMTSAAFISAPLVSRANPSGTPVEFLWQGTGAADQRVRIYDLTGRLVRELGLGGAGTSGTLQWDGRDGSGSIAPAGMYFARLTSGSVNAQTRVVLLP